MVYLVYQEKDLIAETDSLDFLKRVIRGRSNCLVREIVSGKLYKPTLKQAQPQAEQPSPTGK